MSVPGVLGQISRERLADYADKELPAELTDVPARASFYEALAKPGLSIIAEIKQKSPSKGAIATLDPREAALAYAQGGARALSVLTEPRHFGGHLSHIPAVTADVALPVIRKDFTVHPLQLIEAKQAGASAALLIVAVLKDLTKDYVRYAHALGLDVLIEVHDRQELELALATDARIIGVNNRDLRSLTIDLSNAPTLIGRARAAGFAGVLVAESGYSQPDEMTALRGVADAVLIGTSVAGSGDLQGAVARLAQAGQEDAHAS